MDAQMIPAGTEVTATVRSRRQREPITYSGVVVTGRYEHLYLTMSVGSQVVRLPWERVISIR